VPHSWPAPPEPYGIILGDVSLSLLNPTSWMTNAFAMLPKVCEHRALAETRSDASLGLGRALPRKPKAEARLVLEVSTGWASSSFAVCWRTLCSARFLTISATTCLQDNDGTLCRDDVLLPSSIHVASVPANHSFIMSHPVRSPHAPLSLRRRSGHSSSSRGGGGDGCSTRRRWWLASSPTARSSSRSSSRELVAGGGRGSAGAGSKLPAHYSELVTRAHSH
jgi:hypothetical protein